MPKPKARPVLTELREILGCDAVRLDMPLLSDTVTITIPSLARCSRRGAIRLAQAVRPQVRLILIYRGAHLDLSYIKCADGQWRTRLTMTSRTAAEL